MSDCPNATEMRKSSVFCDALGLRVSKRICAECKAEWKPGPPTAKDLTPTLAFLLSLQTPIKLREPCAHLGAVITTQGCACAKRHIRGCSHDEAGPKTTLLKRDGCKHYQVSKPHSH